MTVLFKQSSFSVIFLFASATGACFVHCPDEQRYQQHRGAIEVFVFHV